MWVFNHLIIQHISIMLDPVPGSGVERDKIDRINTRFGRLGQHTDPDIRLIFVTGEIGQEIFEDQINEAGGFRSFDYMVLVTIEETLEMVGIFGFIYGLLSQLTAEGRPRVFARRFRVQRDPLRPNPNY